MTHFIELKPVSFNTFDVVKNILLLRKNCKPFLIIIQIEFLVQSMKQRKIRAEEIDENYLVALKP